MLPEDDRCKIAINPDKFDKLITALRTAVDNDGTRYNPTMVYYIITSPSFPMRTSYSTLFVLLNNILYVYLSSGCWYRSSKGYMIILQCNSRQEDDINSYHDK